MKKITEKRKKQGQLKMSTPKPNLTPAQRKAYDARMKQFRQQQQKRRKVKLRHKEVQFLIYC